MNGRLTGERTVGRADGRLYQSTNERISGRLYHDSQLSFHSIWQWRKERRTRRLADKTLYLHPTVSQSARLPVRQSARPAVRTSVPSVRPSANQLRRPLVHKPVRPSVSRSPVIRPSVHPPVRQHASPSVPRPPVARPPSLPISPAAWPSHAHRLHARRHVRSPIGLTTSPFIPPPAISPPMHTPARPRPFSAHRPPRPLTSSQQSIRRSTRNTCER